MVPTLGISEKFTFQEMRRGLKRKLFIIFIGMFLVFVFFLGPSVRGPSAELLELQAKYSKLFAECSPKPQHPALPIIYVVTPTYARPVQKAELTRLSHTLRLVPALHWILVEDSEEPTALVKHLLRKSTITHTILTAPTPKEWKLHEKDPKWIKPRGVIQRNHAIKWIREHVKPEQRGVVYFADDDNVYSLEVFDEMRWTERVGVWPVGLVGGLRVERPIVDKATGKVTGWNAGWRPDRPFPIDMAGFGISTALLLSKPDAKFALTTERGFQESQILEALTTKEELEPKADGCTKVYVWHTRTEPPTLKFEAKRKKIKDNPDLAIEV